MAYEIVAMRGHGAQYIVSNQGEDLTRVGSKARILDMEVNKLSPPMSFQSILAQGYWTEVNSTPELVAALFQKAGINPEGNGANPAAPPATNPLRAALGGMPTIPPSQNVRGR